jgi:hypothetical protein
MSNKLLRGLAALMLVLAFTLTPIVARAGDGPQDGSDGRHRPQGGRAAVEEVDWEWYEWVVWMWMNGYH